MSQFSARLSEIGNAGSRLLMSHADVMPTGVLARSLILAELGVSPCFLPDGGWQDRRVCARLTKGKQVQSSEASCLGGHSQGVAPGGARPWVLLPIRAVPRASVSQLCPHLPGGSLLITSSPALSICRTTWNRRFLSYFTLSLADDMPM